ncbi:cytochrome P450 [Dendrothele bispora CBS 962.96]|uniref:Cytochrome P450 n=1 Tax=Dendrothele bispora (strain CBS 962.96) TaxID=1314807 RepID=A0A4S8L4R3_DENBC|nr:cytochrome P450 [Dendrothele bispora CBS 962.96]
MSSSTWLTLAVALISLLLARSVIDERIIRSKYKNVISVGPSGMFGTLIGTFQLLLGYRDFIQEGYEKHYGKLFRIPTLFTMTFVVTGHDLLEDVRKASDDQLSLYGSIKEGMQTDYTMEPHILDNPYHFRFVHLSLTRDLGGRFPELREEVITAFSELVPPTDDWTSFPAWLTGKSIVLRVTNKLFVGPPLCHDLDYNDINDTYSDALVKTALIVGLTPDFLKPIVASTLYFYIPKTLKRAMKHVAPLVQERLEKERTFGKDWPGKPNDLLSWLMEKAPESDKSVRAITIRLLATMFAAYRPASMALTQALFDLATYPSYIPELRAEIEPIVKEKGITKESINKMYKLDSFIKESLRLRGGGKSSMPRKVLKDFTFSDGNTVYTGSTIIATGYAIHHDARHYPDPDEFDGFRFARLREAENDPVRYQMVSVGPTYMMFGNGRHACPGRFLVSALLKTMLAHVLMTYDVKLEQDDGVRPPDKWFTFAPAPNETASLMFRKRANLA